jgi:RNA polymerase sigma-70 factor, ECF subfamily
VDPTPAQSVSLAEPGSGSQSAVGLSELLPDDLLDTLWRESGADGLELSRTDLRNALLAVGVKHNFGLEPAIEASMPQREAFWRRLHLADLALAQACALGRDAGWRQFLARLRTPLTEAAIALTQSSSLGEELAAGLYSELYGLTEREGKRWSPLSTYSGRGSLLGWLRAMLAQRRVNHYRKTHCETALENVDVPARPAAPVPEQGAVNALESAVESALAGLRPEERFLLSAYYLDSHTLVEISRVLQVHEATVSRKLKRVTGQVRKRLLKHLQADGLSRRAAEEYLGADPRDLDVNLRKLLQTPAAAAISNTEGQP